MKNFLGQVFGWIFLICFLGGIGFIAYRILRGIFLNLDELATFAGAILVVIGAGVVIKWIASHSAE